VQGQRLVGTTDRACSKRASKRNKKGIRILVGNLYQYVYIQNDDVFVAEEFVMRYILKEELHHYSAVTVGEYGKCQ
jgi:hypothetical protein